MFNNKMDLTIKYDERLFEEGRKVYSEHETFKQIVEFMEHPVSREFYDRWIKSPELDIVLYFLWLYEQIQTKFPDLLPIERLAVMNRLSKDRKASSKLLGIYKQNNLLK